jgi:RNA polymerase sigma factor for flagellar operon FliA
LASIYVISIDASPDLEIVDESQVDLERRAEFKQIREHMRYAIDSLPEKEKKLIKMYYFQNRTLEEAGEKLELSKSWTSRLHARALDLLFKRIRVSVRGETVAEEEEFEGAR